MVANLIYRIFEIDNKLCDSNIFCLWVIFRLKNVEIKNQSVYLKLTTSVDLNRPPIKLFVGFSFRGFVRCFSWVMSI